MYRDIKALEQAGVPILTEDGKRLFVNGRLENTTSIIYRKRSQCLNYSRTTHFKI
ncbi:hypothetical protein [Sphingobacterium sp. UBA6645]|uniref:hypothetical protein n=1 Tax=Sphingobacterium sp. UBA6645 TaxID=1947511 RepID=UPI0025E9F896|nr:hypothetical protein [Sphingobacterium sp. UBA6645]